VRPLADQVTSGRHAVLVRSERFGRFALLCDWAGDPSEAGPAERIDVDRLAEAVLAAYAGVEPGLARPPAPRARVRLRRTGPG